MRVREAYRDRTMNVCRKHYATPTEDLPPLGPVVDARSFGVCESQECRRADWRTET